MHERLIQNSLVKKYSLLFIFPILVCFLEPAHALTSFMKDQQVGFWPHIADDYRTHYGFYGLPKLLTGLSIAGLMANGDSDHILRDEWQLHFRSSSSDDFFSLINDYGNLTKYYYSIPIYLASAWLGYQTKNKLLQRIGIWGGNSFRALLLGAPQQAILTEMLGSPRPPQGPSTWSWFKHNRAVSGHAFYGSLPIISAAQLSDSFVTKFSLYTLSLLPPIARVHHDKHYVSQAFLGWWLALQAVNSVSYNNKLKARKLNDFQAVITPKQIYFQYAKQL